MSHSAPSALITEEGRLVLFRLRGRFFEVTQEALRSLLGLPPGAPGLGITINQDRLRFEFAGEERTVEMTSGQLHRLLSRQVSSKS